MENFITQLIIERRLEKIKIGEESELGFWEEKEEGKIVSAKFLSALKQIVFNYAIVFLQYVTINKGYSLFIGWVFLLPKQHSN